MKCFYHKSDLDGRCSGAIIKSYYSYCEMIGIDYNDALDLELVTPFETVYVVDFSFNRDEMDKLNKYVDLIWIDHHKSAIEKCDGLIIKGNREIGKAGCELTWEYIHGDIPLPKAVYYLGRYDVWDHSDENTLSFQYGMREYDDTRPDTAIMFWEHLFHMDYQGLFHIIDRGKLIMQYQARQDANYAKAMAYELEFHGYRAVIMNKPMTNSLAFKSVYDPDKHDIMIAFGVKPDGIKYTLYCDKPDIDVSIIATTYGGGGHQGVAGFYSDYLII